MRFPVFSTLINLIQIDYLNLDNNLEMSKYRS